jgi:arylsulfatase A
LAGVKLKTKGPIDGLDQSALLLGKGSSTRNEFLYYTREVQAIRQGNYKLRKTGNSINLYDLSKDIGETQNLAPKKPELTKKLLARMNQLDQEVTTGMRPIGTLD